MEMSVRELVSKNAYNKQIKVELDLEGPELAYPTNPLRHGRRSVSSHINNQ